MEAICIAAAKRSPIGRLNGALAKLPATEIGAQVCAALIREIDLDPAAIDEVIIGQVLSGGAGQNPARQTALHAGLPVTTPAATINMVCGAGQKSLHMAAQAIKAGDADLILTGGQDSMTKAPHAIYDLRSPTKMGHQIAQDTMIVDGLWDAFNDVHMGETVDRLAERYQVTRDEQDQYAFNSQTKTGSAIAGNRFAAEIAPVTVSDRSGDHLVSADESPRPETTLEQLHVLKPVFSDQGTITAGNASGLGDGAAAILVGSESRLAALNLTPLARIVSYSSAALDPMDMGLGPVAASRKALEKAGWTPDDLDVLELNEAFAAQAIAVDREMGWDTSKVNPNGGAIALGHPLAGSGCRIVVTLLHEMRRVGANKGLASLCIGGGQGVAICLERM